MFLLSKYPDELNAMSALGGFAFSVADSTHHRYSSLTVQCHQTISTSRPFHLRR
jgi:hypothetical protein